MFREMPEALKEKIGDRPCQMDNVGLSDSQVICFDDMILKIENSGEEPDNEYRMMTWLRGKLLVPDVLHFEKTGGKNYLLMSRVPGDMLCSLIEYEDHKTVARLAADGLRSLWSVGITDCPNDCTLEPKLKLAEKLVKTNLCSMERIREVSGGEEFKSPAEVLCWLEENRPEEELVFSHGDYCMPNIFVKDSSVSGFIDLGRSGTADKYQDISLCYRSLRDNYRGRYGGRVYKDFRPEILFDELGITPDWEKVRYYMLLDALL